MFRTSHKTRLGDLLLRRNLINQSQLEQALSLQQQSGEKLGVVLVQQGWITRQQLDQTLTQQRIHQIAASVLLTCGTLFSSLPRVASAQPIPAVMQSNFQNRTDSPLNNPNASQPVTATSTWQRPTLQNPRDVDAMPLAANPSDASPLVGFCHPLQGYGLLTQGPHGVTHQGRMAYAMDYQVSIGTPVYAMRSGRVIGVEDRFSDTGGGAEKVYEFNYILVEHPGNYRSAYLHLQQGFVAKTKIKVGDIVEAGQLIGYSGNSGWSSGPHLHIEMQKPSEPGSFGDTVPFKLGRPCEPSQVVATDHQPSVLSAQAQGGGNTQADLRGPAATTSTPAINIPLACKAGGCVCPACANGNPSGHVKVSSQDTFSESTPLSDRLEQILAR